MEGINGARLEATRSKAFLTLSNERSGPLICGIGRGGDLRLAIQALVRSMNVRSSSFFTERQNIRFAWVLAKSGSHIDRQLFYLGHSVLSRRNSPGLTYLGLQFDLELMAEEFGKRFFEGSGDNRLAGSAVAAVTTASTSSWTRFTI